MNATARAEALSRLKEIEKRLQRADERLSAGDTLAAIRALAEARRLARQTTVTLVTHCLRAVWADATSNDVQRREACLEELVRLVSFAESALCPACRGQVGRRMKGK